MAITEPTPAAETRWPRWTWLVFPAIAIAIGGGLGYVVGNREPDSGAEPARPIQPAVLPRATPDPPSATEPDPEIEVQEPAVKPGAGGTAPGVAPRPRSKPKSKPKPNRTTPCNVYDHMDGC